MNEAPAGRCMERKRKRPDAPTKKDESVVFDNLIKHASEVVRSTVETRHELQSRDVEQECEIDSLNNPEALLQRAIATIEYFIDDKAPRDLAKSSGEAVENWVRDALVAYGDTMREDGRQIAMLEVDRHAIPREMRSEAFALMQRLNTILTTPTSVDALISDKVKNRID
tara:strand:+ start:248 stop:754 length:507 start_codon:yes stop_codon:yes gene_type:complete